MQKPLPKKQNIFQNQFFVMFFTVVFVGGLIFAFIWFANQQEIKHPAVWRGRFPGTAICYKEDCGKKNSLLPSSISPGETKTALIPLEKENEKLTLYLMVSMQPFVQEGKNLPEASLEIEFKDPEGKRIFYLSKEEILKGSIPDSPNKNSNSLKEFNFTVEKTGDYTLKITPYSYGIEYIDVTIRETT